MRRADILKWPVDYPARTRASHFLEYSGAVIHRLDARRERT
ncbi:hypothetical protein BURPS406E_D0665 [Burkholderia pseudomallei 406e]|uniref:Uncharacterized protein n=1 Tax=Burkholderia pseudomallei (strain 1106a) TaxID=357348 RepID=A3P7P3_BURP0|nr:hypothetical protein BURPS1106A_A2320 [Burkholderia pseudomallei 1106a]EBA50466.1 hypothetical protein BURPS305_5806 [Burkholderia pseudomallei 305]EDO88601.1 hypothetical protein BURPS406E_D0665 [Burkholderia pseudomallei 406e]EDU12562.1 hypothetical protein BURPS1655_D1465 [Burkholderia pseudomallei 1655]EEC34827.1 conserved hypothetical protein [Burkholderia pseudomallei 576]EEH28110.1 conserved hypothetical protein [Burkholderia pseudomallei Pakistan 9]EEP49744.1 conserved hypothetical